MPPSPASGLSPTSHKSLPPSAGGSCRSRGYRAHRARFSVSRAKPCAKPCAPRVSWVQGAPPLQMTPLEPPTTAIQRFPAGPTDIEPSGHHSRSRALNPPPFAYTGLQPLQPVKPPLSRSPQGTTTLLWRKLADPTDIEPTRLDIRFRAPNRPPSRIPGQKAPRSETCRALAAYNPPLSESGRISQVPPISSPGGSIFGFARQTGPLVHSGQEAP
jgi:hypothetical protein